MFDAGIDPSASSPIVFSGAVDRILLSGLVVTPDTVFDGEVLVEGSTITCVGVGGVCGALPAAAGATLVLTNGIIAPGMIDTHHQVLFDVFDDADWMPSKAYGHHAEWPNEPKYQAMLAVKDSLASTVACEMVKWGELKAIVAGTTSVVGNSGLDDACVSSLARSIDTSQNGLGSDKVRTSAGFPPQAASANASCSGFTSGATAAYLVPAGEGTDANALAEFATLGSLTTPNDCLYAPQTTIVHGTAFGATQFATMGTAGMKLAWSPRSNFALYGTTTNIPAALDANVLVAIASGASPSGSTNLLDEMRFANTWDDLTFGDRLKPKDLVTMTTKNPAAILGLGNKIGTLAPGLAADIVVYTLRGNDAYASILAATPLDVRMTMVGGRVLYGDLVMLAAVAPDASCDLVDICATIKFACVAETTTTDKLGQTAADISKALGDALVAADGVTPSDGYSFAPLAPLVKCP